MPTRDTTVPGTPCWIDLMSSDTGRSREFYGELFGWTAEEPTEQFHGYFNFRKDGVQVAGCMSSQSPDMPDIWSVYLATKDAKTTVDDADAHGSQIIVAPMDVADLGAMAVITDPGGAAIGIWQPGRHQGFGVVNETGAPSWFELHTRDYQTTVDFYREVFGLQTHPVSDTPEFRYTILKHGDQWLAELGGSTVAAAQDTPYGRLATATDPTRCPVQAGRPQRGHASQVGPLTARRTRRPG